MLEKYRRALGKAVEAMALVLARLGFTPAAVCVLGFLLALSAGLSFYIYGFEVSGYAGLLILGSGLMDALDGAVARATGRSSRFGGFLDSTVDRLSEAVILSGMILGGVCTVESGLTALVASFLTSYTRARAESIGVNLKGVGLGERAERILILGILSLLGYPGLAVVIVALLALATFIHRFLYVHSKTRGET